MFSHKYCKQIVVTYHLFQLEYQSFNSANMFAFIMSTMGLIKDSGHIIYIRIRHSFAHVWTILNKMAAFGVNIYRPSASEHGQNITNITMI